MGAIIDPTCAGCSLKRLTVAVLIMYLFSEIVHLLAGIYHLCWEAKSSPPVDFIEILLVKNSICIIVLHVAFLGICKNQPALLVPVLITRLIICVEDVIDLLWFIFKGQAIVPTSIPIAYTENIFTELIFGILFLAITFYFFAVIYSYYCELKEVNRRMLLEKVKGISEGLAE
ncbi:uncharacterized protein LOC135834698 isoform X2 [Planococcus citri]|uniref:uncharacterized protein LOC135834698 isoform X2 n=1 Tax=Planococcus citri TaxID=170843 RepID=UPI0031F874B9